VIEKDQPQRDPPEQIEPQIAFGRSRCRQHSRPRRLDKPWPHEMLRNGLHDGFHDLF
jgi:hypothetical protein